MVLRSARVRSRPASLRSALAVAIACAAIAVPAWTPSVAAAGRTFYVDCSAGADDRSGTSAADAWRTLGKANNASLGAGDALLLKRGCTWTGPLRARWTGTASQPVTIGAYGSGELPRIQNASNNVEISGSYQVIEDLQTRADPPGYDGGCQNQPAGYRVGFRFYSGAAYNVVRNSVARDLYIGIFIDGGAHHNSVLRNTLRDNDMKDANPSSDAGAVGIVLTGDDNEIAYNDISGSDACSRWFGGRDGSAIDVYGGRRNRIHHNVASQNNNFLELGNARSADNVVAYNRASSTLTKATWLVVHGRNSNYGPVLGTRVFNNSAYLTGSESYALQCIPGCGPDILSLHNNVIWSEDRIGYANAAFDEGHNLFWRSNGQPKVWFPTASTSRVADPRWMNPAGGDFHLRADSPAIDRASWHAIDLGFGADLDGVAVPQGPTPDIGGYERGGAPPAPQLQISDGFGRTVVDGWGSAPGAGPYALTGPSGDFDVTGSAGTMRAAPDANRAASLDGVSARDVRGTFRVRTDRLAAGAPTFAYLDARRSDSGSEMYRIKVEFGSTRDVWLQATRVIANGETSIGPLVDTGITHSAGTFLTVRFEITGAAPTTLRARAWADGQGEPSTWQVSATDATGALQGPGALGLRTYVSENTTNGPVLVTFDDLSVSSP